MSDRLASKVLLVGWDTADWKIISPMIDAGQLPCLARLVERGTTGRLGASPPILSPILWTSMVTGRRADAHQILSAEEPDPDAGGSRPSSSTSRTCKALWNILTQAGLRAHAVNWVASHPTEPISGACVSDRFATVAGPEGHAWPLRPGSVHPPRLVETLAELRVHPAELSSLHIGPFVPDMARVDQTTDRRLETLAVHLAESASYHAAATYLLEHEPCDFLAVRYGAFDPLASHFLPFLSPRPAHVSEADHALYKDVIPGIYRFHDLLLARLLELAGPDATVIVVSDHGFRADHLRTPAFDRYRPETVTRGHRSNGFIVLSGPRVRCDELIHGATVLDVAPTILALLGLPAGQDQEGRPLLEALDVVAAPPRIPSWESVPVDAGLPPGIADDDDDALEIIDRLAALGYVEDTGKDRERRTRLARQRTQNLALAHLYANRPAAAAPLFEALRAEDPDDILVALNLAHCHLLLGRADDCRRALDEIRASHGEHPSADLIRYHLELAGGRPDAAVAALLQAERNRDRRPGLECLIGQGYLRLGRAGDAERAYRAAIEADEELAPAHHGLALALLQQRRPSQAAEAALAAIGLNYHLPEAHRILAVALLQLGQTVRAVRALETCLALDPSDESAQSILDRLRCPTAAALARGTET
jgi:predicted AlkP superfamily phosphohydrolase/phosphomutase/Flp pilus assembly protein TadD